MSDNAFNEWYHGFVGFRVNSERMLDSLRSKEYSGFVDSKELERWMKVCWNNALEAAENYNSVDLSPLIVDLDSRSTI